MRIGILNFLKPPGMTSHDAVALFRRLTGVRRIGHTGTLDPGAAGVLPLCFGQATRVAEYVLTMEKSYRALLALGKATDTEDSSGNICAEKPVPPLSEGMITGVFAAFTGRRMQTPPMYSAVRIKGQKLYELARRGETVERKARPIHIHRLELRAFRSDKILFDVSCSHGTYIRTLCREIAEALGTTGHLSFLLRTAVGPFLLSDALTVEECTGLVEAGKFDSVLKPTDTALYRFPSATVTQEEAKRILNGAFVRFKDNKAMTGKLYRVYDPDDRFIAVCKFANGELRPQKVFHDR